MRRVGVTAEDPEARVIWRQIIQTYHHMHKHISENVQLCL